MTVMTNVDQMWKSKSFQTLLEIIYLASSLGSHIWSLFALIQKRNPTTKVVQKLN